MEFRKLRADEIDVRVGGVYKTGISLLLYKDARCDMAILDETVGAAYWQRDHKEVKGTVYCGVGIYLPNPGMEAYPDTWVWKWDAGTESNTEAAKGAASDSFKRACVNWGIGRELYTAPLIFIKCATIPGNGGRHTLADRRDGYNYTVTDIAYKDGAISRLKIAHEGKEVWAWGNEARTDLADGKATPEMVRKLQSLAKLHGDPEGFPLFISGVKSWDDLTGRDYIQVVKHYEDNNA
ncbi:hypothetical protein IJI17_02185 [Candidatus Saccharibacteria bacterium]|nr:hypothetical protein [Achromobacter sp.]MBQ2649465.1 hypothetical protein [Achromobacter sp.]MBQ3839358.1 hypothetical protein [Fibrobacter sp.]MBQ6321006.1 hypothetical protein [Candidatus Saccharibacteria bacterium]